ncbi:MAG TPA: LLM class flavin-dependent oxidoreductase [Thermomicrobiales bacterium]|nr:LLM class flavin-dependent oxidoreductase [Thermomicrobiales bacterium]
MRIGAFSRTAEECLAGETPRFADLVAIARAAEAVGLDSYWVPDHLGFRAGDPDELGCWETMTLLGGLAAATERITVGPLVAATGFRPPAVLARAAVTLDEISGGRFILAAGAGNWPAEHRVNGIPFDHRVSRFEESLQVIGPLLRGEEVTFAGQYVDVERCRVRPGGPSTGGPPLWVGARGERMMRNAARHADAWNIIWPHDADEVRERWGRMVEICNEVGRDPGTLGLTVGTHVRLPGDDDPDDDVITGADREIADQLLAFEAPGVDHLIIDFRPETTVDVVHRFGRVLRLMGRA